MAIAGDTSVVGGRPQERYSSTGPSTGATGSGAFTRTRALMRDDRLAARAARGDHHAFAELYRRHHQRLYRYCLSLVGDPEDAADALQSTMANALSALERGEAIRGVRPWLFRIAHNAAIDLIRVRPPRAPLDEISEIESSALTAPSAASEAQRRADLAEVVSDIRELPERQGSALIMRELSELSYAEIAGVLETSPLAARQLVHQARSLLHDNRDGRTMDCDTVRRGLGETDGTRPRDRRMRAHLAACQSCAGFGNSIRSRRSALAALVPPLAPAAASGILARLFDSNSTSGAGIAADGLTAGAAKLAGASGIAKLAATAAGTAVVAAVGGAVVAGGALLGSDQVDSRATLPSAAQALLNPDQPALRPPPPPGAEAPSAPGGSGDGPREAGTGADPSTADEPGSPAGSTGDGLPSAELAQNDPPVDLGAVELPAASGELPSTDGSGVHVGIEAPGGLAGPTGGVIELPDGSGGSELEVPDVEVTEPTVKVPDAGSIELPDGSGGSEVEVPDVEVTEPTVKVPESGSVEAPDPSGSAEFGP